MPRPKVVVTLATAPSRRGVVTATGNAFMVFPASSGLNAPRTFTSATDAASVLPSVYAQYVADLLTQGAPQVTAVRANVEPVNATATSQATWKAALDQLPSGLGIGQVLIPGVASPAAHAALVAHSATTGRVALLDGDADATVAELTAFASAVSHSTGSERAGLCAPWLVMPGDAGVNRQVPGSVIAAGLAARMDGRAGHAGRQPAGTQEFGDAGKVYGASDVTFTYTDSERDALADVGVTPFVVERGGVYLSDWLSVSADPNWYQLNCGRLAMQITAETTDLLGQFLHRPIDGRGQLFAEVEATIDGRLLALANADAIYRPAEGDAYRVNVKGVTTIADIQNGTIRCALEVAFTRGARLVPMNITVQKPGEVGGGSI